MAYCMWWCTKRTWRLVYLFSPPLASRHWAPEARERHWERKRISLILYQVWGGGLICPWSPRLTLCCPWICVNKYPLQAPPCTTVTPPSATVSLGMRSNPHHSPRVCVIQISARYVTGITGHALRIPNFCTDTNTVEEVCDDVELPLQSLYTGQHSQPVIRVEERRQLLDGLPEPLNYRLRWQHHCHPVPDHVIHHHVEYQAGQRFSLGYPTISLEGGGEVSTSPCDHPQPSPVRLQESDLPGSHAIYRQDVEAPVPVQVVVLLIYIQ